MNVVKNIFKLSKNTETRRKQVAAMKTQASNKLKRGEISEEEKKKSMKNLIDYKDQ